MQRSGTGLCLVNSDILAAKYDHADEAVLVRGCLRGHRAAQKALYERFAPRMLGVCSRYAQNRDDAADILQEGFVKVFTRLGQFRADGPLEGWIRRIMVTTAINFLKRNKYLLLNTELQDGQPIPAMERADAALDGKELLQLLATLPPGYRSIVNLYAIEGYSHREVGELLGIGESTSRSQYARARELLVKMMKRQMSYRQADK